MTEDLFAPIRHPKMVNTQQGRDNGATMHERKSPSEAVSSDPQFPQEGFTVVERNLRDRTFSPKSPPSPPDKRGWKPGGE